MISIDITSTGAGTVTPPAVGLCAVDQVVLMAPYAAPWTGTTLPSGGTGTSLRLRRTAVGIAVRPSVQTTALRGFAVVGVPAEHPNSTPGDLPPEDPLSR